MKIISNYEYKQLNERVEKAETKLARVDEELKRAKENNETLVEVADKANKALDELAEKFEFKEKKAVLALEDKLAKTISELESKHNKEIVKLERKHSNEKAAELEEMMKKNYDKLSESMTKLHEEGNVQTKFMQEMTSSVIKAASGFNKAGNSAPMIENKDDSL